ncbi:MAG: AAA family ATPase, partial [Candidatus Jordarchaeales archaeon]
MGDSTVYIKKIAIRGFKSFGNRKVIVNFSKGFVAIVGPNGSGKSNLLDAIRFGIGMMSAKSMRATSFSDLIYYSKDGKGRGAKYASVSLYLDNTDRRIPVDSDTVVITRQIDLEGRGVYKLNGRVVPRGQIVDLLEAAGISPDGYNMIPQGEILEVIRKGPVEIRRLFEDIAGIASFDEKKERAQKELEIAEQNLRENLAQLREVQSVVERLAREKEGALKYKRLDEEIRELRAKLCFAQLKRESEKLNKVVREIDEKREKIRMLQEEITNLQKEKVGIEETSKKMRMDAGLIEENLRALELKISETKKVLLEKKLTVNFKERELAEKDAQLQSLKKEVEAIKARMKEEERDLEKAMAEHKRLSEEAEAKQRLLRALRSQMESMDAEYVKIKEEMERLREELDELRKSEVQLETEKKLIEKDIANSQGILSAKKKKIEMLRNALESTRRELALVEEKKEQEEKEREKIAGELKLVEEEEERRGKETREIENIIQKLKEEIIKIKAINEERERILKSQSAVYEILKLRDKGVIDGIYGTVAELAKTKEEYALALEAAAGQRLNYVVVENDSVAVKCIDFLKKNRLGRVTFIPLNLVRPRPRSTIESGDGIIGAAIDLIEFDEKFRPAFEYVFGNTIIVNDLETARRLHDVRVRKVTLEGEILETSGVMIGGHLQRRQAVFLQEVGDLSKLEDELRRVEELRAYLISSSRSLATRKQSLMKELKQAERELYIYDSRIKEIAAKVSILEKEIEENEEEVKKHAEEIARKEEELKKVAEQILSLRSRISLLNDNLVQLEKTFSSSTAAVLQKQVKELENEIGALRGALSRLEVEIARKQTLVEEHLMMTLREKEEALVRISEETERLKASLGVARSELDTLTRELELLEEERKKLAEKKEQVRAELDKLSKESAKISAELEKLVDASKKLELEVRGAEVEKNFIEETINKLQKQAEEYSSYSFDDVDVVDFKELEDLIRVKEKEKKNLEPVNMLAIELYEKERKRYEELISRRNKLIEERESILNFIREVEKDKRNTFLSTLYTVERNFKQIFSLLSPGGSARFVLENPSDPF